MNWFSKTDGLFLKERITALEIQVHALREDVAYLQGRMIELAARIPKAEPKAEEPKPAAPPPNPHSDDVIPSAWRDEPSDGDGG